MNDHERILVQRLEAAIHEGSTSALEEVSQQLDEAIFDRACFQVDVFQALCAVVLTDRFANMVDGVSFLKVFEYNLALLSDPQCDELAMALVQLVPRAQDDVTAFLAVEMIAELWTDERTLVAFEGIRSISASDSILALLAHGYHWLAKRTADVVVRARCIVQLQELETFPSQEVQSEARYAIQRLADDGVADR